jgi:CheY-like chemotaxis protein/HPt (histidine-containing phosphotransfer) domain-containing protein
VGILNKLGLSADAVADGVEVLKALASVPYDLVLMDVQMPLMDGLEATRQIRNPQSAVPDHEIPVIAMTAHAMQGDREKCLEAGMNGYVTKPVSLQSLAEALEPWITRAIDGAGSTVKKSEAHHNLKGRSRPLRVLHPGIFDRRILLDRLAGDQALTDRVIAGFLEDIPKQLAALKEAVWQGKADAASAQAHKIKGAAANIGGDALCEAALLMEQAGKEGTLEQMKALVPQLERRFGQLRKVMESGQ